MTLIDQYNQSPNFLWVNFFEELANELLKYKDKGNRHLLIEKLEMVQNFLEENSQNKSDARSLYKFCAEVGDGRFDIDPFTVFVIFNRSINPKTKQNYFEAFKNIFDMKSSIPTATDGVSVVDSRKANFFNSKKDIELLWDLFDAALKYSNGESNYEQSFIDYFDEAKKIKNVKWRLTFALYWVRPNFFLPLDGMTRNFISSHLKNIVPLEISEYFDKNKNLPPSGKEYLWFSKKIKERLSKMSEYSDNLIPMLSYQAYQDKSIANKKKIEMESEIKSQLKLSKNVILHGAPGTGKTYIATKRIPLLMEAETIDFVQFHPSYDYTDFVEGLRPVSRGKGPSLTVCFERKNGVFYSFCENALKAFEADENQDKKRKFIFIIDEINRGELSKIFGELFFCIDPGYRGVTGAIKTQYENLHQRVNEFDNYLHKLDKEKYVGNGWFFVPENVYIIGTMNDVDRSVESMDIAFRRRFSFIEIKAEDTQYMLDECDEKKVNSATWNSILDSVKDKMNALNKAILDKARLSCDYQIGASYFMKLQDLKDEGKEDIFALLWKYHLEGLLKEYLRGEPNAEDIIKNLKKAYDNPKSILQDHNPKTKDSKNATEAVDEKSSK